MPERSAGSTVPRRQLGRYLRDLRNQARLTVKAAAHELEWSEAKMWRIETGQTSLRSHDAETMCKVYGAPPDITEALMGLAKETKARGWWHSYGDVIPEGFDVFIGLEEAASEIDWYESEVVPGLLQTPDYARTIIADGISDGDASKVDTDEVERRVRLRTARQVLLTRESAPTTVRLVLNEGTIRRPTGSEAVMAEQLRYLIRLSELPTVKLRVVPFTVGLHPGMATGQFGILRFPKLGNGTATEPPTVYSDGFTGCLYLDKPSEVDRYDRAFNRIWNQALTEEASQRLFLEVAESYEQQQH